MRRACPISLFVTRRAQSGSSVVCTEKFSIAVIMRVMARGALHLLATVQGRVPCEHRWIGNLPLFESKGGVVDKRDGMVVREVGSQRRPASQRP